ncbi:MAG: hypothetical protein JNK29_11175, partial [Anaerolineales bacterium]|nr:hypothetical protein [Anaerolineales bacterium]
MAVSARPSPVSPPRPSAGPDWLTWIMAWQVLLGLGLAASAGLLALGPWLAAQSALLRYGAAALLAAGGLASLYAAWALRQRRPAGRVGPLRLNELLAVLSFLKALNWLGVVLGLDAR